MYAYIYTYIYYISGNHLPLPVKEGNWLLISILMYTFDGDTSELIWQIVR